jgi:hypothetical protein
MAIHPGLRWNCWPDPSDHLLLTAIVHRDEQVARDAWRRSRGCVTAPTNDQRRLFGLLAQRVAALDPQDPFLPELQAVARTFRVENLQHFVNIDAVLAMLDDAGIEAVLLKGVALLLSVYDNTGLRPIADVDLWVRPDRHADALAVFAAAGAVPDQRDHFGNHAMGMSGGPISVDVHRAISQELVAPGVAENGWGTFAVVAAPKALPSGRHPLILESADALLHTIVHGLQWNGPVPLRWVADAVQLLDAGAVDAQRLCALAEQFAISPVILDALRYVDEVTGGLVDPAMLRSLSACRTSRLTELRLRAFHERPANPGEPPPMGFTRARLLQRTKGDTPLRSLGHLPEVLRDQYHAASWLELLRRMTGAALMGLGRRLAGSGISD